jgi:hypothetical protein
MPWLNWTRGMSVSAYCLPPKTDSSRTLDRVRHRATSGFGEPDREASQSADTAPLSPNAQLPSQPQFHSP